MLSYITMQKAVLRLELVLALARFLSFCSDLGALCHAAMRTFIGMGDRRSYDLINTGCFAETRWASPIVPRMPCPNYDWARGACWRHFVPLKRCRYVGRHRCLVDDASGSVASRRMPLLRNMAPCEKEYPFR